MSHPTLVALHLEDCFLCRGLLSTQASVSNIALWDIYPHRRLSYQQSDQWGDVFRAFGEVLEKGIRGEPGKLRAAPFFSNDEEPRGMVYFAHVDCWRAANKVHGTRSLLSFARSARPLFPHQWIYTSDIDSERWRLSGLDLNWLTPLGEFLAQVCRLPDELQAEIIGKLGGDKVANMIRAMQTATSIPSAAADSGPPSCELRTYSSPISRIYASTSIMFGRAYLRDIRFDSITGAEESLCIEEKGIRGIRFAINSHGIRGIRILYHGATESEWLGNHQDCLYGETYGDDLSRLWVTCDGFRLIRIDFTPPGVADAAVNGGRRALWDHEMPLQQGLENVALDQTSREFMSGRNLVKHYPSWCVCEFIPLACGGASASGVSVFLDDHHDMTGVRAYGVKALDHGASTRERDNDESITGFATSLPVHLALRDGERIAAVWVRCTLNALEPSLEKKNLVVSTNLGRTHVFGAYRAPNPEEDIEFISWGPDPGEDAEYFSWTPISPHVPDGIVGLFFSSHQRNPGVSYYPDRALPEPGLPALPRANIPERGILSTAPIENVKTIQVQERGDGSFVEGLRLDYHDGGVGVLGHWDPCGGAVVSTVYDTSRDGKPLLGIGFKVNRTNGHDDKKQVVREVAPVVDERPELGFEGLLWRFFYASDCKAIAWWWEGNGRCNEVEEWKGSTQVPREPAQGKTIRMV